MIDINEKLRMTLSGRVIVNVECITKYAEKTNHVVLVFDDKTSLTITSDPDVEMDQKLVFVRKWQTEEKL